MYLLTYVVVIALEKDLGLVEPVAVKVRITQQVESFFEPKKLPKKHFTPGSADLNGLVNSKMFNEQASKLAWIKKRLLRYVVCLLVVCVCVCVCVCVLVDWLVGWLVVRIYVQIALLIVNKLPLVI